MPADSQRLSALREELRRQEARESLLKFTEYTHPHWDTNWHHELMCRWLELLARNGKCPCCGRKVRRLAIHAPPRHSKTEIVGLRFPAWYLGHHPTRQVIYGTAVGQTAIDTGAKVRDIIKSKEYTELFDNVTMKQDAQAAGRWVLDSGGIAVFAGVGVTIVGRGAHLWILDDLHGGRNKADSDRERDVVENWYSGDVLQRAMRPSSGLFMFTRWHPDDLSGRVLPDREEWVQVDDYVWRAGRWHVIELPAILHEDTDHEEALWPGEADPEDDEEEPETLAGFPLEYLQEMRAEYLKRRKSRDWFAQYQQQPQPEMGTFIQRGWFEERWTERPDNMRVYMQTDWAVTQEKDEGDPCWTEHGVFGIPPDGRLYVLDWRSGRDDDEKTFTALFDLVAKWQPDCWWQERGLIKNALAGPLKRLAREYEWIHPSGQARKGIYFRQEDLPSIKDKLTKGKAFQTWACSGRVIFPAGKTWAEKVINQCVAMPGTKFKDKFDVMSQMCMALDTAHPGVVAPQSPAARVNGDYPQQAQSDGGSWRTPR